MEEKTIYDLELHEILVITENILIVQRVASGWLYKSFQISDSDIITFVPFDNKFDGKFLGH